jgi:hypothetical protein
MSGRFSAATEGWAVRVPIPPRYPLRSAPASRSPLRQSGRGAIATARILRPSSSCQSDRRRNASRLNKRGRIADQYAVGQPVLVCRANANTFRRDVDAICFSLMSRQNRMCFARPSLRLSTRFRRQCIVRGASRPLFRLLRQRPFW